MRRLALATAIASLIVAACGVDTTGVLPGSVRPARGSDSAPVTIEVFSDFLCPHCAQAHQLIDPALRDHYGSSIRFVFRHFPLEPNPSLSFEAAEASECAADQGKFWEFVDLAFQKQASIASIALGNLADTLALNRDLFDRCLQSDLKATPVQADRDDGEKRGVTGTPAYFVNGVKVDDTSVTGLSAAIDAALRQIGSVPL